MPTATALAQMARDTFRARGLTLPQGARGRPTEVFPGDDLADGWDPDLLFRPASELALHVEVARQISSIFGELIDDACGAIARGWSEWQRSVSFAGVVVNAGVGLVAPGGMIGGPGMAEANLMRRMRLSQNSDFYRRFAQAILGAVSQGFGAWSAGYTCAAVPFPGAMVAGPAPPSVNTPIPLAAGTSPGAAAMAGPALAAAMAQSLGKGMYVGPLFDALGGAVSRGFDAWLPATLISGITAAGGIGTPAAGAAGAGGGLT